MVKSYFNKLAIPNVKYTIHPPLHFFPFSPWGAATEAAFHPLSLSLPPTSHLPPPPWQPSSLSFTPPGSSADPLSFLSSSPGCYSGDSLIPLHDMPVQHIEALFLFLLDIETGCCALVRPETGRPPVCAGSVLIACLPACPSRSGSTNGRSSQPPLITLCSRHSHL